MAGLMDTLHEQALAVLCEDCPERTARLKLDPTNQGVPVEELEPNINLGIDVVSASRAIGAAILRDEVGCEGTYNCGHCGDSHCGAQRTVNLRFSFAVPPTK